MSGTRIWRGTRMRDTAVGADPDAATRPVTLPASWDDRAAEALAALAPGPEGGPATLPRAADAWIRPIAARARSQGHAELADMLHMLLLHRQAAPTAPIWCGPGVAGPSGFVLNLPAFHDGAHGFDTDAFTHAVTTAATALRLSDTAPAQAKLGITDLDGLLALLGFDYDSDAGRAVAATIAALLRATADLAMAGEQPDLLSCLPNWPMPPVCPLSALTSAANAARVRAQRGSAHYPSTGVLPPGPADALLGAEAGGIAPAFSPVGPDGALTRAALARLAALGVSAEQALALLLNNEPVLATPSLAAHQAMHDAVAPYLHAMPPRPVAGAVSAQPPHRRELPARRRGYTQKAAVGGHRIYVRTGEYADGTLGEVHVTLPRETPTLRAMMESLTAAVNLGLQHGVRLEEYVAAFTLTRFGPAGIVEGDADVGHATSLLDYVFRNLAASYLGGCAVPEGVAPPEAAAAPLLPLDLPAQVRRRSSLRLVA